MYNQSQGNAQYTILLKKSKSVFTCGNTILGGGGGYVTFFHQGNKLLSNQKGFFSFFFREPSNNYFVISRHHFSSLAYIYMHKCVWPLTSFEKYILEHKQHTKRMAEHKWNTKCTEPVTPKTPRAHERKSEQETNKQTNKHYGNLESRKVLTRDLKNHVVWTIPKLNIVWNKGTRILICRTSRTSWLLIFWKPITRLTNFFSYKHCTDFYNTISSDRASAQLDPWSAGTISL